MSKLTKRVVNAALPGAADHFVWCGACPGFGLRVYPSGRKVFIAQVRVGRATRRVKIGPYGPFTVEQARARATEIIRLAASGVDPQRERRARRDAITVSQLCEAYLDATDAGTVITRFGRVKRAATMSIDRGRISRHIVPLIGSILASDLGRSDVQRMVDDIAARKTAGRFKGRTRGIARVTGGAGTAARVVGLLGGIYTWAERRGLVPGPNPCRGIEKAASGTRDRVLNGTELRELGKQLIVAAETTPQAAVAVKLIALTGLRRQEACGLRWSEVDELGRCLRLAETKTGRSVRPIGARAIALLKTVPVDSDTWVFPSCSGDGATDLKHQIAEIFDAAGLQDARSHDLRRTFATTAADLGYSDATIADMLGHSRRTVTARHYIRRPDEALVAAVDKVSATIETVMSGTSMIADVIRIADDVRFREVPAKWVFWAVSSDVDHAVARMVSQKDRARGILFQADDQKVTIWVKTWSQVINECKARLRFFAEKLHYTPDRDASLAHLKKTYHKYLADLFEVKAEGKGANGDDLQPKEAGAGT
jgi:integrase